MDTACLAICANFKKPPGSCTSGASVKAIPLLVFPYALTSRASAPACSASLAVTKKSSGTIPPSILYSFASSRTRIGKSFVSSFLIAEIISTKSRALFSTLPPYSSVLLLTAGDRKLEMRYPCPA